MLFQVNMVKSFWAEVIATATYFINQLPSSSINDVIQRRVANPVANGSAGLMTRVTFVIFILRQEVVLRRIHCFTPCLVFLICHNTPDLSILSRITLSESHYALRSEISKAGKAEEA